MYRFFFKGFMWEDNKKWRYPKRYFKQIINNNNEIIQPKSKLDNWNYLLPMTSLFEFLIHLLASIINKRLPFKMFVTNYSVAINKCCCWSYSSSSNHSEIIFEGWLKYFYTHQDNLKECEQIRFIFQHSSICGSHTSSTNVAMLGSHW